MLIHGRLRGGRAQGVHLRPALAQLHLQHGALGLRRGAPPALDMVGGQEHEIKHDERRGQKFDDGAALGVEHIGINRRGIIEAVIGHGQAAEQQQRRPRACHGVVGRVGKINTGTISSV